MIAVCGARIDDAGETAGIVSNTFARFSSWQSARAESAR